MISLIDDGTMDTVFECDECGRELRYSSEGIERDEDGDVLDSEIVRVGEEHESECEGFEEEDYNFKRDEAPR